MYEFETYAACYKLLKEMFDVQPGESVCITYDTESSEELSGFKVYDSNGKYLCTL